MDNQMDIIGIYDFNNDAILVELIINEYPKDIDFIEFCVPDNSLNKSSWQVPYMEQYLGSDGVDKLCETYGAPAEQTKPTRLTFFLYKTGLPELSTPYGNVSILSPQKMPDRLVKIIDFDEFD